MEENKDMELDPFLKKRIKEVGLEQPSANFTVEVTSKIERLSGQEVFVHKPLIPRNVWWIVGLLITGSFGFVTMYRDALKMDTDFFNKIEALIKLNIFGRAIPISETTVYAFAILTVFVYLQIFLLKRHFFDRPMA